jgi:Antidote-toxin recognition MazE, bacterial antitoxin
VLLTLARHSWPASIRLLPPGRTSLVALPRYYIRGYAFGMVLELNLRKVGNSVGVVLPKKVIAGLNVAEGDTLGLTDSPDGCLGRTLGGLVRAHWPFSTEPVAK